MPATRNFNGSFDATANSHFLVFRRMGEDDSDKVSLKQHSRDHPAIICFAVWLSFVWISFDLCLKHDEERDGDILRVKSTARNDLNVTEGIESIFRR